LLVSLTSAFRGSTDIAFGNVVGSNIANILLILGITATIYPLSVKSNTIWKEIPMSFLGAILLIILGFSHIIDNPEIINLPNSIGGEISRSNGLVLLSFFVIFLFYTFGISKVSGESDVEINDRPNTINVLYIIGGLTALALGSHLAVENAISIARSFGLSDALIGLTLIAIGTSLPELATNVTAALKKNTDIAVGNIVGSNIFNIFLILGTTATVKSIPINQAQIFDITVLLATTVLLFGSLFVWKKHRIGRVEGVLMLLLYATYTGYLIVRG
jgi:cation:H+ antiporter